MPTYRFESDRAGQVLKAPETVKNLETGVYVYLLTDNGRLAFAPKYDAQVFLNNRKGLATHKNLIDLLGEDSKIMASGEFRMAFGFVVALNNRSGNFRGQETHLQFATAELPKFGLNFAPDLVPVAIRPEKGPDIGHAPSDRDFDLFQLELHARVKKDKAARELGVLYEELVQILLPYSSPRSPIGVSSKIVEATLKLHQNYGTEYLIYGIETACTVDGLPFALERLLDGETGRQFLKSAPRVLEVVNAYLAPWMSRADKGRLRRLIARFRAL